jgi:hypothetical protein
LSEPALYGWRAHRALSFSRPVLKCHEKKKNIDRHQDGRKKPVACRTENEREDADRPAGRCEQLADDLFRIDLK